MRILLTGATGFIGRHLAVALRAAGHEVIEARRVVTDREGKVQADFARDLRPDDWLPKLAGIECVINAVGILRQRGAQTFERIHTTAPCALFEACVRAGVARVVQISALGAETGRSAYFSSKHAADEFLVQLPLDWTIVQPSVVFGPGGSSARLFTMLASLPLIPVPGQGRQPIQPVHIDDLTACIVALLADEHSMRKKIPIVGRQPLLLREFLSELRISLGLRRTLIVPVPMWLMRIGAAVAQWLPRSLLDRDTLVMLEAGNTADPTMTSQLLGREPRHVGHFVAAPYRSAVRRDALLSWLLPLLRFSVAVVWIWTGLVSLGLYPVEQSYALLARVGAPASWAPVLLIGAGLLDLALGLATLVLRRRRPLWLMQMGLIAAYTVIISIKLPEFWLHPYGPILKNLPLLVSIYALYLLESDR
nr:short chain dehydrogenase [Gammaproteobacteria bacterium]